MLYKTCSSCKRKLTLKEVCKCRSNATNKEYDRTRRTNQAFYKGNQWRKLRKEILVKYNYVDLYAWRKYKRIIKADVVHHIEELKDREDLALEVNNLIPLSHASHNEIHGVYERSKADKKAMQIYLKNLILR